ncbi:hypothetical protein RQP46_010559 [Phenoliferia psychrophenolica]
MTFVTVFRQTIFLKRREDLSHSEFREYWSKSHAATISSLAAFQKNVLRYEQIYPSAEGSGPFLNADDGSDVVAYDGVAVLDYPNREAWQALTSSDEWKTTAGPDNANFVNVKLVKRVFSEVQIHVNKV